MATIDFAALRRPLSEEDPCGPDLDLEYDDDYMNFVANIEGLMPQSFYVEGVPFAFDPAVLKVDDQIAATVELLGRSRDLRLLTLMARLLILSRDLDGFAQCVDTMASLLSDQWDAVHPRAEGGSLGMRAATLGTLDESTVVFSLQYARLCESRRTGPVNFRSYMYATREAEARTGEETPVESVILQSLRDSEEQAMASRKSLETLRDALGRIGVLWIERADMMSSPKLSAIIAIVKRMLGLIDMAFPRAGAAAEAGADGAPGGADGAPAGAGAVNSAAGAVAALAAAAQYFLIKEPSSPVLPLVAQAQQLLGKSFIEVLQTLLPDHVGAAAYQIGGRQYFPLPVERLSSLLPTAPVYGEASAEADSAAGASADSWGNSWSSGETETPAESAPADGEEDGPPQDSAPNPEPAPPAHARSAAQPAFNAATRGEALALLDHVAAFLRAGEPSSPVPWLIERARALADRDFLSVLRSVLRSGSLTEDET